jgi:DNA-binding transcriptional ArsR family regulator
MKTRSEPGRVDIQNLTDPRAIRALAHPVRLAILELLHAEGTANATEAARETGESPQSCSYHLRALARYGFVEEVETADARETRWQLKARGFQFSTPARQSPEYAAAATLLQDRVYERDERIFAAYLQAEEGVEEEWRDAATILSGSAYLTAAELAELRDRVRELIRPYQRRKPGERPDGSRQVHVVYRAVPRVGR